MRDINGTPLGFYDINSQDTKRSFVEEAFILEFDSSQIHAQHVIGDYYSFLINGYGLMAQLTINTEQYFKDSGDTKYYSTIGFALPLTSNNYIFVDTRQQFNNWLYNLPTIPHIQISYLGNVYNLLDISFAIKQEDGTYKVWRNSSINQTFYSPYYMLPFNLYGGFLPNAVGFFAPEGDSHNPDISLINDFGQMVDAANNVNPNMTAAFRTGAFFQSDWENYEDGFYAACFPQMKKSNGGLDNPFNLNAGYSLMCGYSTTNVELKGIFANKPLYGNISNHNSFDYFNGQTINKPYNSTTYLYHIPMALSTGSSLYNFMYFDVATQSFRLQDEFSFLNTTINDYNRFMYTEGNGNTASYPKLYTTLGAGLLSSFATNPFLFNYEYVLSQNSEFKFQYDNSSSNTLNYMIYQSNLSTFFDADNLSSDDVRVAIALVPYESTPEVDGAISFIASIAPLVNIDFGLIPLLSVLGLVFVATIVKMIKGVFE